MHENLELEKLEDDLDQLINPEKQQEQEQYKETTEGGEQSDESG